MRSRQEVATDVLHEARRLIEHDDRRANFGGASAEDMIRLVANDIPSCPSCGSADWEGAPKCEICVQVRALL